MDVEPDSDERGGVAGPVSEATATVVVWAWRSERRRGSSQKTSRKSRGSLAAVSSSIASAASVSRRAVATPPCAAARRARASRACQACSRRPALRASSMAASRPRRAASSSPIAWAIAPFTSSASAACSPRPASPGPLRMRSSSRPRPRRRRRPRARARAAPRGATRWRRGCGPLLPRERRLLVEPGRARQVAGARGVLGLQAQELRLRRRGQLDAPRRELLDRAVRPRPAPQVAGQPLLPQKQDGPGRSSSRGQGRGLWPHSPPMPLAPSITRPSTTTPPPTPVPRITPNTTRRPSAAPSVASDTAKQLASFENSDRSGSSAALTSLPKARPFIQTELARRHQAGRWHDPARVTDAELRARPPPTPRSISVTRSRMVAQQPAS